MISPKMLIKLATKWHSIASIKRKRLSIHRFNSNRDADCSNTSSAAGTRNFVVYTNDQRRFIIPIEYLSNNIIKKLLKISEEVFGLTNEGPIKLPCDSIFMGYVVSPIKKGFSIKFFAYVHGNPVAVHCLLVSIRGIQVNAYSLVAAEVVQLNNKMISPKKLLKLAKKWQMASIRRKRITLQQNIRSTDTSSCSTSPMSGKGHFVVYSADQKRFLLPLKYLNNEMIRELFDMAEEEFGLPITGRLTLPCDAELMKYAIALIKQNVTRDVEKALLMFIVGNRCSSLYLQHQETIYQLPICSL